MKQIVMVIVLGMICSIAFAETTCKLVGDKVEITEKALAQPVTTQDGQGKIQAVQNAKGNIETTYTLSLEDVQMQLIQINKQKKDMTTWFNERIAIYDETIKNLEAAEKLFDKPTE